MTHGVFGHGGYREAGIHSQIGRKHGSVYHIETFISEGLVAAVDDPFLRIWPDDTTTQNVSRCSDVEENLVDGILGYAVDCFRQNLGGRLGLRNAGRNLFTAVFAA